MISSANYDAHRQHPDKLYNSLESETPTDDFSSILNALFVELPANFPSATNFEETNSNNESKASTTDVFFGLPDETEKIQSVDPTKTGRVDFTLINEDQTISEVDHKNPESVFPEFPANLSDESSEKINPDLINNQPSQNTEIADLETADLEMPEMEVPGEPLQKIPEPKPIYQTKEIKFDPINEDLNNPLPKEILLNRTENPEVKNPEIYQQNSEYSQLQTESNPSVTDSNKIGLTSPKQQTGEFNSPQPLPPKTDPNLTTIKSPDALLSQVKSDPGIGDSYTFDDFEIIKYSNSGGESPKTETGKFDFRSPPTPLSLQTEPKTNMSSLPKLFQEVTRTVGEQSPIDPKSPETASVRLNEEIIVEAELKDVARQNPSTKPAIEQSVSNSVAGNLLSVSADKKGKGRGDLNSEIQGSGADLETAPPSSDQNENISTKKISGDNTLKPIESVINSKQTSAPERVSENSGNEQTAESSTRLEQDQGGAEPGVSATETGEIENSPSSADFDNGLVNLPKSDPVKNPEALNLEFKPNIKVEGFQPINPEIKEINQNLSEINVDPNEMLKQVKSSLREYLTGQEIADEKPQILKLRLRPAELGEVEIHLEKNSLGKLSVRFETENETTQKILAESFEILRDSLQDSGWQVENLDVSNNSNNSSNQSNGFEYREEYASRERTTEDRSDEKNELGDSEQMDDSVDHDQTNRLVNLRA